MSDMIRNIPSIQGQSAGSKPGGAAPASSEDRIEPAKDTVTIQSARAKAFTPAKPDAFTPAGACPGEAAEVVPPDRQVSPPPTVLPMEDGLCFRTVPGLPHIAVASLDDPIQVDEAKIREVEDQMLRHMRAWPSLTAVITVGKMSKIESSVLVASRPDAIKRGALEGVYEVVMRLSSSPSIKEAAKRYPSGFHVVKALNREGTLHEIHLPEKQTETTVSLALQEGGKPNQLEQVRQLIENLPKGRRVALLVAGPSGAGKSTLIRDIKKFAEGIGRKAVDLQGDMYFKDIDDADYPLTRQGAPYWDSMAVMDMSRFKDDIAALIRDGVADTPVYNFKDTRPGGWRRPVKFSGFRENKPRRIDLGPDDILVIDSLHAANEQVISHLEKLGLPHATVYLDSQIPEDRLGRRILRDYEERGGILPKKDIEIWEETTWPGEVEFVRPTILQMDPAQDTFLITKFPKDLGLSKKEIETRAALLDEYGLPPTYEAFTIPADRLGDLARALEQRLEEILRSSEAGDAEKKKAQRELERLRTASKYQGP